MDTSKPENEVLAEARAALSSDRQGQGPREAGDGV